MEISTTWLRDSTKFRETKEEGVVETDTGLSTEYTNVTRMVLLGTINGVKFLTLKLM